MLIFLFSTIIAVLSFVLVMVQYNFIKNVNNKLENRIKRYINTGIQLFFIGSILIIMSLIGTRNTDIQFDSSFTIIAIFLAITIITVILLLWKKLLVILDKELLRLGIKDKKNNAYYGLSHRFKSITIYGLIYGFGIMFYLLYFISYINL